jgi:hypothetical protein
MLEWIEAHEAAVVWMVGASLVVFAAVLVITPWMLLRLPADYFAGRKRPGRREMHHRSPLLWLLLQMVRNAVGGVFVLLGIVMLVTPGQGVLTIVAGIMLMNFPGKFKIERWVVSQGPLLRAINYFRRSRGRPAFILDGES